MIICHCGPERFRDSALAAESLQKMGYKNVRSIAGGFKAWKAAGIDNDEIASNAFVLRIAGRANSYDASEFTTFA